MSLQKEYITTIHTLLQASQKYLYTRGIFGIEQMLPFIDGRKSVVRLLKDCDEPKTRVEIFKTLYDFRLKLIEIADKKTTQYIAIQNNADENINVQEDTFHIEKDSSERAMAVEQEISDDVVSKKSEKQMLFTQRRNCLSIRANHILSINGLTSFDSFVDKISDKTFSFINLKQCGRKTAKELNAMAADLLMATSHLGGEKDESNCITEKILKTSLSNTNLSVRAINKLKSIDVKTVEELLSVNYNSLMSLSNCGEKTVTEIKEFVFLLTHKYELNEVTGNSKRISEDKDPIIKYISETDLEFANHFKEEYGYWPMLFILYRHITNFLSPKELAAFESRYGIREHKELESLTENNIQQLFSKALKRLQNSVHLKQLCEYRDWDFYNVHNIPFSLFDINANDNVWQKIEKTVGQEGISLDFYIREKVSSEEEYENSWEEFDPIRFYTFRVFLQFWGFIPYWADLGKKEIAPFYISDFSWYSPLVINKRFISFKFQKAIKEIVRLQGLKTEEDIIIPIDKYLVSNINYWKKPTHLTDNDKEILIFNLKELILHVCHVRDRDIIDNKLFIRANTIDYRKKLYEILLIAGTRLHRDELFKRLKKVCCEMGGRFKFSDSTEILHFLTKDPRFVPVGRSGYWELKEWGNKNGSIKEIAIEIMRKAREPIQIEELAETILKHRPDSNMHSVYSVIRQATSTGELLLFYNDYIGYPKKKYSKDYIIMPQSFDGWIHAYKEFVKKNRRHPYSNQTCYEGSLYRWHYRSSQYTDLTSDEILKFDVLEKELAHYPQNATEYNFLQNCNLYKKFVESNKRMLAEDDDLELFNWFYKSSRNYSTYNDNRNKYFSQLLQSLSAILY